MTKEVKGFDACFSQAIQKNRLDANVIKANQELMMLCIDLYYMGQMDGVAKLYNTYEEKSNVAVPPVSTPAV